MSADRILEECVVLKASKLHRVLERRQNLALRPLGITGPQLVLLASLYKGEAKAVRLSNELNLEKSTLSRNLVRLCKAGLIAMGPLQGRMGRVISLTELGLLKLRSAFPIWEATQKSLWEQMRPDEKEALALLA